MQCLTAELRRALLAQTCCGIEELCSFLECELDLIWECQDNCNPRLRYIYTHLGLIEAAQIFARNKIDTMTREASSQMQERYTAFSTQVSNAERDASGRSCSWAAATSSQYFNRDSEDQAIGWSDYRHLYTSDFLNNGYDKSCRHTTGYGFHKTQINSFHTGFLEERGNAESREVSSTHAGTEELVPVFFTVWDSAFTLTDSPPFVEAGMPIDPLDGYMDPPSTSDEVCPAYTNDDPNEYEVPLCIHRDLPSAGSGFTGSFTFQVGLPTIGVFSISWNEAKNQRQYFTCGRSTLDRNHFATHDTTIRSDGATDASEDDNQTYSSERTDIAHLVRKYGITTRRSETDNDAEENAEGFSNGMAQSESERNARATAHAQSRSEAESVRHSESHFRRTERANNDMVSAKYGQISKHLKALWDRVWANQLELERQFASRPYGGSMNCRMETKSCLPARRSWLDLNRVMQPA